MRCLLASPRVSSTSGFFDSELALTNLTRFAEALTDRPLDADTAESVRQALAAVGELDLPRAELAAHAMIAGLRPQAASDALTTQAEGGTRVITRRFASSVLGLVEAIDGWRVERAAV